VRVADRWRILALSNLALQVFFIVYQYLEAVSRYLAPASWAAVRLLGLRCGDIDGQPNRLHTMDRRPSCVARVACVAMTKSALDRLCGRTGKLAHPAARVADHAVPAVVLTRFIGPPRILSIAERALGVPHGQRHTTIFVGDGSKRQRRPAPSCANFLGVKLSWCREKTAASGPNTACRCSLFCRLQEHLVGVTRFEPANVRGHKADSLIQTDPLPHQLSKVIPEGLLLWSSRARSHGALPSSPMTSSSPAVMSMRS